MATTASIVITASASGQELHADNRMPVYPGGIKALNDFVNKNLNYPSIALETGISGIVQVNYLIDKEGKVRNIRIMQGLSSECDAEARRITGLLHGWEPGIRNGKPVEITVSMPVEFKSDKEYKPGFVSGIITEKATGKPIEGAFVIIKDTNIGSVTNESGSYRIDLPENSKNLLVFSIGYSSKEISIGNHSSINVDLDPENYVIDFDNPGK
ncbi:MAG TPA: TonB family protein [Bacteroidales bacterium]|nr:TonB family protein [Bacteroidales bacterium]